MRWDSSVSARVVWFADSLTLERLPYPIYDDVCMSLKFILRCLFGHRLLPESVYSLPCEVQTCEVGDFLEFSSNLYWALENANSILYISAFCGAVTPRKEGMTAICSQLTLLKQVKTLSLGHEQPQEAFRANELSYQLDWSYAMWQGGSKGSGGVRWKWKAGAMVMRKRIAWGASLESVWRAMSWDP